MANSAYFRFFSEIPVTEYQIARKRRNLEKRSLSEARNVWRPDGREQRDREAKSGQENVPTTASLRRATNKRMYLLNAAAR